MKFKRYASIENSYRQKYIDMIILNGYGDKLFYVEEKVHGANFSIWYDGSIMKCAKRSAFLPEEGNFFNSDSVLKENEDYVKNIYEHIKLINPEIKHITIYGEIFGGHYPHPDVPVNMKATKVQKGVFYHPDNKFIAFDLLLNDNYILHMYECKEILKKSGILYSKALFIGSLEECLKYTNEYQTKLPDIFCLPMIENNICEGNVIKPIEPLFIQSSRVVLKNKNEKFSEKQKKTKENKVELSPRLTSIFNKVDEYINDNRYESVVSKIGEVTMKDFGYIIKLMVADVYQDILKDIQEIKTLEKSEIKRLNKFISGQCVPVIKKNI